MDKLKKCLIALSNSPVGELGECLYCGVRSDLGHDPWCPVKLAKDLLERHIIYKLQQLMGASGHPVKDGWGDCVYCGPCLTAEHNPGCPVRLVEEIKEILK